jgi:hypothetical protein
MKSIKTKIGSLDAEYRLIEKEGKTIIKIPSLRMKGDAETIQYDRVVIDGEWKTEFIKLFFDERAIQIVYNGTAYVIDEVVFDEIPLPKKAKSA